MSGFSRYEKIVKNLVLYNHYKGEEISFIIAKLFEFDSTVGMFDVPWWKGKSADVIGFDWNGNFIIHASSGSVFYWVHESKTLHLLAKSLDMFARKVE